MACTNYSIRFTCAEIRAMTFSEYCIGYSFGDLGISELFVLKQLLLAQWIVLGHINSSLVYGNCKNNQPPDFESHGYVTSYREPLYSDHPGSNLTVLLFQYIKRETAKRKGNVNFIGQTMIALVQMLKRLG